MMKMPLLALISIVLFISSCAKQSIYTPSQSGQKFTISNAKGQKLFDVTSPTGIWKYYDRSKKEVSQFFKFMYQGPNQGLINAEIRIMYIDATWSGETLEEAKEATTIAYLNKSMARLLDKDKRNNLQDFYKPKELKHGIKNIAGLHCRYFSIINHSGPRLDTPTPEFRGMGSARKQEEYLCPLMRDGKPWYLGVHIVYQYSDNIRKNGLDINFYETVKDFDRMLKPMLESLKLYGELKQY